MAEHRFEFLAGELCLDLVNTLEGARGGVAQEQLRDYDDLVAWGEQAGVLGAVSARRLRREGERRAAASAAVLARARALRETLYRLFSAAAAGRAPSASDLDALNAELARALPHAKLARTSSGVGWIWDDADGAIDGFLWPIIGSAARLLTVLDARQVRECASDTCSWLFVDATKNHSRRWCDMRTCGNRAKVREHRRRQHLA